MPIRLETSAGEFVSDEAMPQFDKPPKVVMWGQRVFAHYGSFKNCHDVYGCTYREVFCFYVTGAEKNVYADLIAQRSGTTIGSS